MKRTTLKTIAALVLATGIMLLSLFTGAYLTSAGLVVALYALARPHSKIGRYGFQVWIAFDKLGNAILGGSHKETISSRLGKSLYYDHPAVFGLQFIDELIAFLLDLVDPDHCQKSIDWNVGSAKNMPFNEGYQNGQVS